MVSSRAWSSGKFFHVRQGNLAGQDRVVVGHVRLGIIPTVFVFHLHAVPKRLETEPRPVHPDPIANPFGFFERRAFLFADRVLLALEPSMRVEPFRYSNGVPTALSGAT